MAFSNRSFDYSSKYLIPCVVMDGPPTEKTDGAIGVLCIDKESGNLYKCVSANYCDRVFTWRIVGDVSDDKIRQSVSEFLAQNPLNGGLSGVEKNLLLTLFRGAVYQSETGEETAEAYRSLQNLWCTESAPDSADLTGIIAVYSGGDVPAGTAVTDLTGITVTAHYSDGSTATVPGYTLGGSIEEGSNTITVSYGGKTTTFAVTGVAESGGEPTAVNLTEATYSWPDSTEYSDGGETAYSGAMGTQTSATMWYSEPFEQDTVVAVSVLYGTTNANLRQYCGCVSSEQDFQQTSGSQLTVHFMEQIGTASTSEYTAEYTVRAGYRLAVINYNSGKPKSVVVMK